MFLDPEEYSQLRFDVHEQDASIDLVKYYGNEAERAFPTLKTVPKKDRNRLFRYIVLLHDLNSPIRKNYPDLNLRKEEAALIAGYDLDKEQAILSQLYAHDDEVLVKNILSFLRFQDHNLFSILSTTEQALWETLEKINSALKESKDKDVLDASKKKFELIELSEKHAEKIESLKHRIFGGDKELEEMYSGYAAYTPEAIAEKDLH